MTGSRQSKSFNPVRCFNMFSSLLSSTQIDLRRLRRAPMTTWNCPGWPPEAPNTV